jgi:hypothetical protein
MRNQQKYNLTTTILKSIAKVKGKIW